MATAGRSN